MITQRVRENPETQIGLTPKLMFVLRYLAGSSLSQTQLGTQLTMDLSHVIPSLLSNVNKHMNKQKIFRFEDQLSELGLVTEGTCMFKVLGNLWL